MTPVTLALSYLEAFLNARNGRCLPTAQDYTEAERALAAARGVEVEEERREQQ